MTDPAFESPGCSLVLPVDGAGHRAGAAAGFLPDLLREFTTMGAGQPGLRLTGSPTLRGLLRKDGPIGALAMEVIGAESRPVRAILFDKSPARNWGLAWHQDRTICVTERVEVDGFGPWSVKAGLLHVAPPFSVLAGMVTLRVHLDDVPLTNAPLLIAPGSHRLGRVPTSEVEAVVRRCGTHACLAAAGDVWVYSTPILHASEVAAVPGHRRVLQVDFAACELPGGLRWLGV